MARRSKMHPELVKAGIRQKYGTLTAFERQMGLKRGSAVDALRGRTARNATISAMAQVLGVEIGSIIQPRKPVRAHKKAIHTSVKMDLHRLNEGAN